MFDFRKIGVARLIALLILAGLASAFWQWHRYASGQTMVSDATMFQRFHQNRAAFEQLREMTMKDSVRGTFDKISIEERHLSTQRVAEYRKLIDQCGAELVQASGEPNGEIVLLLDIQGLSLGGREKGIEYRLKPPRFQQLIWPSLDKGCFRDWGACTAYRQIEGNWWLVRRED
jgi:hypothetical protein